MPPKGQKVTQHGLDRSSRSCGSRIDKLGVSEPEIRKQGGNQIVVQLPGVQDPPRRRELIGKTAQLEFYDLEGDLTGPSVTTQGARSRSSRASTTCSPVSSRKAKEGTPTAYYLFDKKNKRSSAGRRPPTRAGLFSARHRKAAEGRAGSSGSPRHGRDHVRPRPRPPVVCPGDSRGRRPPVFYLFKNDPTNPNEAKGSRR